MLPPEKELESTFQVPVATGQFVWIANPTSGRVAYVDAATLSVSTVEAGNGPTYLAPLPGTGDAVIVLNTLSNDATVLRATSTTTTAISNQTVPGVAAGSNTWAVSPDGRFAIAWTDARRVAGARPSQGFQSVTVIDLGNAAAPAHTTLAVGFRPVSLTFAADSRRAFAVTQDGVSVISLGGASDPRVSANVALEDDPNADVDTRDVSVTADGRLALIRREGSSDVGIVDLGTGARSTLTLSGAVTDLDVSADGARAVAVVRDTAEVAIIPLAGAAPAAAAVQHLTITGETVGQVVLTTDGGTAVLYSNATQAQRITVVALTATPTFHVVRVHAPVLSVFTTPDGVHGVVLHPTDTGTGTGTDGGTATDGGVLAADAGASTATPTAGAFSLVPLDGSHPPFIQPTDAPIQAVALAPSSDRVLITVRDDKQQNFGVYLGRLPELSVDRYPLASPPTAAGVVAGAGRGYVAQDQPDGRITFITLASGEARTLTGYELAARVVDWSQP
jgi:hypothetical protein